MDYETFAKTYFNGSARAIAKEFGLTRGAVQFWKRRGIPKSRQAEIELWLLKRDLPSVTPSDGPSAS